MPNYPHIWLNHVVFHWNQYTASSAGNLYVTADGKVKSDNPLA